MDSNILLLLLFCSLQAKQLINVTENLGLTTFRYKIEGCDKKKIMRWRNAVNNDNPLLIIQIQSKSNYSNTDDSKRCFP